MDLSGLQPGVSSYFTSRFATTDGHGAFGDERYCFPSLESIPDTVRFTFSKSDLDFRVPPGMQDAAVVDLPLLPALETLPGEDRFDLSCERWGRVLQDLSEGWCYMPWMTHSPEDGVCLMDGRHRIVAMMRFMGRSTAPFVVSRKHLAAVTVFFGLPNESGA